jgi:hypothetical protein
LAALGQYWDEEQQKLIDTGKMNLAWVKLLLERAEGKPGSGDDSNDKMPSVADRVSEANRDRINAIAEGGGDD